MARVLAAIVVASCLYTGSAPARADEVTDRLATATSLFEAGQALVREGKLDAACAKFEESYRLEAANGTLINLADCYERQGNTAKAWLTFRDVAGKSARAGQDARAKVARERASRLEPILMRLRVTLADDATPGTVVTRDGIELGAPSLGVAVPVDPGAHQVEARAPGFQRWRRDVTVAGEGQTLDVTVPALVAEAPPGPNWQLITGVVGFALGGATAIAGVGLGVAAKVQADDADCDADDFCSDEGLAARSDAVALGNVGTGLGVAGAVLAGVGLTLWLTAPSDDVAVGVEGTAARLRWRF